MDVQSRANYKAVWTAMSQNETDARAQVIGDVDDAEVRATAEHTRRQLEQSVGLHADDVVLEIGCGIGRVGQALFPHVARWIGSDVSPNMLVFAQQRLADAPNVSLVETNGSDLGPIRSASIDLVYCTVVFMHLDEWDRYNYVLEGFRVLRPGGRIFIDNFNLLSNEGWAVFESCRSHAPGSRPAAISKSSTPDELETYLRRAGFEQVRVFQEGTWVWAVGVKPGSPEGPRLEPIATLLQGNSASADTLGLRQRLAALEQSVELKNQHIQHLETLLRRVENGRVMRLLNSLAGRREE